MDTSPNITSAIERTSKEQSHSWDRLCVSEYCPIKHPHNFGLRPKTLTTPLAIWQDADAVVAEDDLGYADTEPPPLIKAMIDTLRSDPMIGSRYPRFTDILRDFYRAHGGRSDKYHGVAGMFGLGMDRSGRIGHGFYPLHRHPDVEGVEGWFGFEREANEGNIDSAVNGGYRLA